MQRQAIYSISCSEPDKPNRPYGQKKPDARASRHAPGNISANKDSLDPFPPGNFRRGHHVGQSIG